MTNLQKLSLRSNLIANVSFIKSTLLHLKYLITIDLSYNKIKSIRGGDFDFSLNLQSIDLSSNAIKEIQENSFRFLSNLHSFKIANNRLESFKMKLINWTNIWEMDLSFNKLDFDSLNQNVLSSNMSLIKLRNISIRNFWNFSLKIFLNQKITVLDFSNNYIEDFAIFDNLENLVSFELTKS